MQKGTDGATGCSEFDHMSDPNTVFIGLHACGKLTDRVIQTFVDFKYPQPEKSSSCTTQQNARATQYSGLCVVGCCYKGLLPFVPQSDFLGNLLSGLTSAGPFLTTCGLELAQFNACEEWASRPTERLLQHSTRAMLQVVLKELQLPMDVHVGRFKLAKGTRIEDVQTSPSFAAYATAVIAKLQQVVESKSTTRERGSWPTDEEVEQCCQTVWQKYSTHGKLLACVHSMRQLMGQLVESLIVLDRLAFIYQHEETKFVGAMPLFDPVASPRTFVLVAIRSV
eukprot:TRINITY_DN66928_c3_g1_i3.p1 TRINITY_DN66928_c3_g1~~TRINITY_DN66928_c3_g1_i3.p1  ORF type:complete len:290 (-),score=23.28 TRINITY_DN66928_c3_g1_i3:637-1479(-)